MSAAAPWWQCSAVGLAAAYRRGAVTPTQVLADCLARIDAVNPRLNAFVALRREAAMREAARSTLRFADNAALSPLDGIPLAVKDNIPGADLPTTWGSPAGRDHAPAQDERVLARARAAGAIVVGKTNVPEFTLEGYTANPLFGVTRNPWNPALTPGGSSGGSVAAVAAGMVPLALGTDGGGSTRRPASHTGLVGFKPSIGAIAREHGLPPLLLDYEVIGPIARDVADLQLLFGVLHGPHPGDHASCAAAGAAALAKPFGANLRVLYAATLQDAPVDPHIASACLQATERLRAMGHQVTVGRLPVDVGLGTTDWPQVGQIGLAWLFERYPAWRNGASDKYLQMAQDGAQLPGHRLWQILAQTTRLRSDMAQLFTHYDLVVTPATAALPWAADQAYPTVIDGQPVGPRGHGIFTAWVNAAGLPAIAMPCRPSPDGLPAGVQVISGYGTDLALLQWALAFEATAAQGWQFPPI